MAKPKQPECKTCKFFLASDEAQGGCHAEPPIMIAVQGGFQTMFPIVRADMWCGRFATGPKKR